MMYLIKMKWLKEEVPKFFHSYFLLQMNEY